MVRCQGLGILAKLGLVLAFLFAMHQAANANRLRIKEQELLTKLLDENKYDKRIRAYGKTDTEPTNVTVNFYVRSIEKLDDVKMEFGVQLTFRMQWLDTRLKYDVLQAPNFKLPYLTLAGSSSKKIWVPDLFFSNEKEGHTHDMLLPNEYTRIFPDGEVLVSQRISLVLSCPMNLKKFPFDEQSCGIRMASYGWTTADVIFAWKQIDPIQVTSNLHLPKFFMEEVKTDHCDSHTNTGIYSCIRADFSFKREFSYYQVQVYIPTSMMVIVAWLSFFLNYNDASARVTLSTLVLLAGSLMTFLINGSFPRVAYTRAIDVWTGICITFLFSTLIEFVIVNWVARRDKEDQGQPGKGGDVLLEYSANAGTGKGWAKPSGGYSVLTTAGKIDYVARIGYPCLFLLFNIVYWSVYKF